MFLFSRQLDTQCAIFGTNGTPAYSRSASRTRWNYRSFACSVTGNDIQPYTYLQVDIPLLLVLPSELGPEARADKLWIIYWLVVTLYCHTRLVHTVIYKFDICVELFPVFLFFFLSSFHFFLYVYIIYIYEYYCIFRLYTLFSFVSLFFYLFSNLFVSFLFFFFFGFSSGFRTDMHRYHRVALYREHLSIKEEVRTKPVPGANSFDQSTDRPINQPHRPLNLRTKTNSPRSYVSIVPPRASLLSPGPR